METQISNTSNTSTTPKRVSFGSTHGSMVETLIIDDIPQEEKNFYRQNIMNATPQALNGNNVKTNGNVNNEHQKSTSHHGGHVTFKETTTTSEETPGGKVVTRTIVTSTTSDSGYASLINNDTNLTPDRTREGMIAALQEQCQASVEGEEPEKKPAPPAIRLFRSPSTASSDNPFTSEGELSKKADYILRHSTISRSEVRISDPDLSKLQEGEITQTDAITAQTAPLTASSPPGKENGETVTPQGVQVEVGTANASQPQPQTAEQVKLKDKSKCKCCVVQ